MHFSTENYSTAAEYFTKALESPDLNDLDRFRLYLRIGDCHRKKGNYRDARESFGAARLLLGEEPDLAHKAMADYREAFVLLAEGDYDDALKIGFEAYRHLRRSDEHGDVAYSQLLIAACYQRLGLLSEAEEFFMDALSSFRRIDDRVGVAYVYNNLGLLHKNACRWNRALASLSKSLDLAKNLGLTQHMVLVHLNLGVVYGKLRRYTDSLAAFSKAESMAERLGDRYALTKALYMKGRVFVQTGEYCKAEKYILRGQALASEQGYKRDLALTDEILGEMMIARGQYDEALVNLSKGLRLARKIVPQGDVVAEILRRIADVYYAKNDVAKALEAVEEGLGVAENCGEQYEIGYFLRARALCQRRLGDRTAAIASLKESVDAFGERGNEFERTVSAQALAQLYVRRGDQESLLKARQMLADVSMVFGRLDEPVHQIVAHVLLSIVEERLGNIDDALLAVYEADRLADEEQSKKFKRLLTTIRERLELRMTSDTSTVLEQIPMFGEDQSGLKSRNKMSESLASSLKFIIEKSHADCGFVAIPSAGGHGFEVVCRNDINTRDARRIMTWYNDQSDGAEAGLLLRDIDNADGLDEVSATLGRMVFQELGFEGESLGLIFVNQDKASSQIPTGQEALHFVGAYSRLISLSVFELIRNERRRKPEPKPEGEGFESIVTENTDMIKLLNLAERVAHSKATVLLQGETGTGKGLIAYAVHLLSDRRDKHFVHVNCAAMPEALLESELFGHVKGAFTGAASDKDGLLIEANGGTIFLDEIAKTSLAMQGKLLQYLDTNKVRKVGSNDLRAVNVRVICASKGDLLAMCDEGTFLEDLFYRINDFPLTIPPLRDRKEDVELLFFHYLRKFSQEMGKEISNISDEALQLLRDYYWAGNVRELEKIVKRAVILADSRDQISVDHLPPEVLSPAGNGELKAGTLRERIEKLERVEIQKALDRHRWNKSQTAGDLGISYPSLLSKIKRYNLRNY